jgi:O-antigen ligase
LAVVVSAIGGYLSGLNVEALFRVLVLTNVLVVAYIVLLRSVVAGLVIYLYALVFLNYYWRIVIPGLWPDLDIPRLMFAFLWLLFVLEILLGRRPILPNTAVGTMMLWVIGAIILSEFITGKVIVGQFLNGFIIPYSMFMLCKNVFTDRRQVDRFVFWLAIPLSFYFPVTSILEHYEVYALIFPTYIGQAVVADVEIYWGGRAMGAFLQPVATGFAMIAMYVLAMYCLSRLKGAFAKLYMLIISIVTPIGIFFTYTRSVFVGFFTAMVVLFLFSRRLKMPAFVLIVGIGLAVMGNWSSVKTGNREAGGLATYDTAQGRMVLAQASLRMFMDHPFFGVGFTQFIGHAEPYVSQVRSTVLGYKEAWIGLAVNQHNQLLTVLTEIGLVGFVPLVLLYYLLLRTLWKARFVPADSFDTDFVVVVAAVVGTYLAEVLFVEPRYFEFMNTFPFMLAGIVAGGYHRAMIGRAAGVHRGERLPRKEYVT